MAITQEQAQAYIDGLVIESDQVHNLCLAILAGKLSLTDVTAVIAASEHWCKYGSHHGNNSLSPTQQQPRARRKYPASHITPGVVVQVQAWKGATVTFDRDAWMHRTLISPANEEYKIIGVGPKSLKVLKGTSTESSFLGYRAAFMLAGGKPELRPGWQVRQP